MQSRRRPKRACLANRLTLDAFLPTLLGLIRVIYNELRNSYFDSVCIAAENSSATAISATSVDRRVEWLGYKYEHKRAYSYCK